MLRRIMLAALLAAPAVLAQTPQTAAPVAYDLVVSVRPSASAETHLRIRMDNGAIYIEDATIKDLLANVYGLRGSLIFGLPKWAENERFSIKAKVLAEDPEFLNHVTRAQRRSIFEKLLAQEFGVATHKETRAAAIYELVSVGKGSQLVENPPPPAGSPPEAIKPGRNGRGNTSLTGTHIESTGVRIGDLCGTLARVLDRNVVDKTGLTSFYDITLNWSDGPQDNGAENAGPSLFAALQEQLGLKLVPAKGPVDVLVVDKVEKPKLTE